MIRTVPSDIIETLEPKAVVVVYESGDGDVYMSNGVELMMDFPKRTLLQAVGDGVDMCDLRVDGGGVLACVGGEIVKVDI